MRQENAAVFSLSKVRSKRAIVNALKRLVTEKYSRPPDARPPVFEPAAPKKAGKPEAPFSPLIRRKRQPFAAFASTLQLHGLLNHRIRGLHGFAVELIIALGHDHLGHLPRHVHIGQFKTVAVDFSEILAARDSLQSLSGFLCAIWL